MTRPVKFFAVIAVVVHLLFACGQSFAQSMQAEAHILNATRDSTMQAKWMYKTNGAISADACIYKHLVYVASEDKYMYALDITTGRQAWSCALGGAASSPAAAAGYLYFLCADGFVYKLNALTGKLIWKFKTGGEKKKDIWDYYLSGVELSGDKLYVGSSDHYIYAVYTATGKMAWRFKTGDMVHAKPVVANHRLYAGSFDGHLYALNADNGRELWRFRTVGDQYFPNGEIQKACTVSGNTVYVGSRDFNIYAINASTGRARWNMKERGSWVVATPFVWKEHVYFGTSDSHSFYSMDTAYGNINWKLPLNMRVYGSAVADQELLYFGCFNGKLYAIDARSGKVVTTFQSEGSKQHYFTVYDEHDQFKKGFELYGKDMEETEKKIMSLGAFLATPLLHNGVLYAGSTDGYFYAIDTRK